MTVQPPGQDEAMYLNVEQRARRLQVRRDELGRALAEVTIELAELAEADPQAKTRHLLGCVGPHGHSFCRNAEGRNVHR